MTLEGRRQAPTVMSWLLLNRMPAARRTFEPPTMALPGRRAGRRQDSRGNALAMSCALVASRGTLGNFRQDDVAMRARWRPFDRDLRAGDKSRRVHF